VIVATWPGLTITRAPGPTSAGPLSGTNPLPSLTKTAPFGPETVAAHTVPHPDKTTNSAPETERVKLRILVPHTEKWTGHTQTRLPSMTLSRATRLPHSRLVQNKCPCGF
jgi:hypothetical protein